jgi:integrase
MNKLILTDKALAALQPAPRGKRHVIYDALVHGFGVSVTDSGHRTFFMRAYFDKQQNTRRKIGIVGKMKLATALAKAKRWRQLVDEGQDPRELERKERAAAARATAHTFESVAEAFLRSHTLRHQRKAAVVEQHLRAEVIPQWRHRPIAELSRHDVLKLIQTIADRPAPAYARNILDDIRALFNWALNHPEYGLEHAPTDRVKPKAVLGTKAVRERVLDDDEIRAIWRAASLAGDRRRHDFHPGYPYGALVQMLLLTGCRVSEVGVARWREFDLKRDKLWSIPAERFKMNAVHRVPLTDKMIELLGSLPHWAAGDALFTTNGAKPFNGFSTSKRLLDRRALRLWRAIGRNRGIDRRHAVMEPWCLHDLRRTVRTRLAALRIPDTIAELVIGHAKKGLARVYDQHQYLDEMREALKEWNAALMAIVFPPPPNVVALKTRKNAKAR